MQNKLTIARRTDGVDAERFKTMIESPSFAIFTKRLEGELQRCRTRCETSEDDIELRRAQGAVQALQVALRLPADLLGEMKKR